MYVASALEVPLIILVSGVVLIGLISVTGGLVVAAIKGLRGGGRGKGQQLDANEAKMFQELYQGLARMEQRIESLETLLFDREKKGVAP